MIGFTAFALQKRRAKELDGLIHRTHPAIQAEGALFERITLLVMRKSPVIILYRMVDIMSKFLIIKEELLPTHLSKRKI